MTESLISAPERPISTCDQDKLGRDAFIERLVSGLISEKFSKPSGAKTHIATGVVIGLTGPWGSGKSSVVNLVHENIRVTHPSALVIKFDPWLISNRDALIHEFFPN